MEEEEEAAGGGASAQEEKGEEAISGGKTAELEEEVTGSERSALLEEVEGRRGDEGGSSWLCQGCRAGGGAQSLVSQTVQPTQKKSGNYHALYNVNLRNLQHLFDACMYNK